MIVLLRIRCSSLSCSVFKQNERTSHSRFHTRIALTWEIEVNFYESVMTSWNGNIFRVTGHLCGEFTSDRWIPRKKASDDELWCFLWFAVEWMISQGTVLGPYFSSASLMICQALLSHKLQYVCSQTAVCYIDQSGPYKTGPRFLELNSVVLSEVRNI